MTLLLAQFLSESREQLQQISESLLALEQGNNRRENLNEVFRLIHTLKGASSLFTFNDLTAVLHAAEDVLSNLREQPQTCNRSLTNLLLDCLDLVNQSLDDIEQSGAPSDQSQKSQYLIARLHEADTTTETSEPELSVAPNNHQVKLVSHPAIQPPPQLTALPESTRQKAALAATRDDTLHLVIYKPDNQCYFSGEDPFYLARQTPSCLWGSVSEQAAAPQNTADALQQLDPYQCQLLFLILSTATRAELELHFQYVGEQIELHSLNTDQLLFLCGEHDPATLSTAELDSLHNLYVSRNLTGLQARLAKLLRDQSDTTASASALRWLQFIVIHMPESQLMEQAWQLLTSLYLYQPPAASHLVDTATEQDLQMKYKSWQDVLSIQRHILSFPLDTPWATGRLQAVGNSLQNAMSAVGQGSQKPHIQALLDKAVSDRNHKELGNWINNLLDDQYQDTPHTEAQWEEHPPGKNDDQHKSQAITANYRSGSIPVSPVSTGTPAAGVIPQNHPEQPAAQLSGSSARTDGNNQRYLKVEQTQIERLIGLVSEMVIARNRLPFLANQIERMDTENRQSPLRELARDIKEQHSLINRITEEMQNTLMHIRMMPFSTISMRFPRLVRDISNRLGKDVALIIEGEETEADKNIIEILADPLMHLIRNSLDHGLESAAERHALGKSAQGQLLIRASQETDQVVIEVMDDGRGIDPDIIRSKAVEKGLLDADSSKRLNRQEAINLIMLPGLSTAGALSDLSGRGVGMDAVRHAINRVNGSFNISSESGKGTRITIRLPMSISATRVMLIETDGQLMGIPMEQVQETVRVPRSSIHPVQQHQTTVLRDQILPLRALNELLNLPASAKLNNDDEYAVLVIRHGTDMLGLLVDNFRGSTEVIQKPLGGLLAGVSAYTGAALIGDGSIVMILNLRALL
jgi:two-component system, chemotaxis family, sensor kinase CheA